MVRAKWFGDQLSLSRTYHKPQRFYRIPLKAWESRVGLSVGTVVSGFVEIRSKSFASAGKQYLKLAPETGSRGLLSFYGRFNMDALEYVSPSLGHCALRALTEARVQEYLSNPVTPCQGVWRVERSVLVPPICCKSVTDDGMLSGSSAVGVAGIFWNNKRWWYRFGDGFETEMYNLGLWGGKKALSCALKQF